MRTYLVVDDEPKARFLIREQLKMIDPSAEVHEAANVDQAYSKYLEVSPHVVFLDIELPRKSGFELIELLRQGGIMPRIVFVSGFREDSYYLDAIRSNALDSLKKPVQPQELEACLVRMEEQQSMIDYSDRMGQFCETYFMGKRIKIKSVNGIDIIRHDEILYCKADGNYTNIYLNNRMPIHSSLTLSVIQSKLDSGVFFRAHRSTLINLNYLVYINRTPPFCHIMSPQGVIKLEVSKAALVKLVEAV